MTDSVPQDLLLDAALQQAIGHHQAKRFPEAEHCYLGVLKEQPYHAIANHNLGLLAGQLGQHAAALPYLQAALSVNPDEGQFWLSYAAGLLANGQADDALDIIQTAMRRGMDTEPAQALLQKIQAALAAVAASAPSAGQCEALVALFHAGRYGELESATRSLIELYPDSAFAWSVLGTALQVQGKDALDAMTRTAQLAPQDAEAHGNLGNALQARGQFSAAAASYRRMLHIQPDDAEAHNNLGNAEQAMQQFEAAALSYRRAIAINPAHAVAYGNLGATERELGRTIEAARSFRHAVRLAPADVAALNELGAALAAAGELDEALAVRRQTLALCPEAASAHTNLGVALYALGEYAEAVASYRRALLLTPGNAQIHFALGAALQAQKQFDEAVACYCRALELKPDAVDVYVNLGSAYRSLGRLDEAMASYRGALRIDPACVAAHINLSSAQEAAGQFAAGVASCEAAIAIEPGNAQAHFNLGALLIASGRAAEAIPCCRRALALQPDYLDACTNLCMALLGQGCIDEAVAACRAMLTFHPGSAVTHNNLLFCLTHSETEGAKALCDAQQFFSDMCEAPLRGQQRAHANTPDPQRRLQVAFVSGDLHNHAMANFIEPIFERLARHPALSLHAYYNNVVDDNVMQGLRASVPHWHQIAQLSDAELAEKIRLDGIDILIDLSGHTAKNRLLTFARKPAPLQASWLGYPGSTGLRAVDYFLTDRFFLPPGQLDGQFSEKLAYLPAAVPFRPSPHSMPVKELPALANGYVTFGSFNRPSKLNASTLGLWSKLLHALPTSRILMGAMNSDADIAKVRAWFAAAGIGDERIIFHRRTGMRDYLALHHQVDICLDTFPYTGGTTTMHSLWMGVPLLTIAGPTLASRTSAGILGHLGLDAFIAEEADDFVHKGMLIAGNVYFLAALRLSMRHRLERSPIGRHGALADGLACALRTMWQRWCGGQAVASFEVTFDTDDRDSPGEQP